MIYSQTWSHLFYVSHYMLLSPLGSGISHVLYMKAKDDDSLCLSVSL